MPTVSLSNGGATKMRALQLLNDTGARLSKIDRSKLNRDLAATYDRANEMLAAARQAATDQDYVAASGFAEKASLLAGKLSTQASSP